MAVYKRERRHRFKGERTRTIEVKRTIRVRLRRSIPRVLLIGGPISEEIQMHLTYILKNNKVLRVMEWYTFEGTPAAVNVSQMAGI